MRSQAIPPLTLRLMMPLLRRRFITCAPRLLNGKYAMPLRTNSAASLFVRRESKIDAPPVP